VDIRDRQQPLLVSLPSERDKRRGQTKPILLVPELCCVTGVDERMRNDFRFKKAIDQYTKIGARDRCNRLADFVASFNKLDFVFCLKGFILFLKGFCVKFF
jgi:aubergine-like protein